MIEWIPLCRANWRVISGAMILIVTISGCAGTSGTSVSSDEPVFTRASDCIFNRGIRDFTALDDRNLLLYGPGGMPYHVTLATPSINLKGEFRIGIQDADGRICPFGGDAIVVNGIFREVIPIRSIEAINKDQAEDLKIQYGLIEAGDADVTVTEVK